MAKLNDDTHVLMDGAVKVYKRSKTKRWQATFQIGGRWVRVSTGKRDLDDAKRVAHDQYLDYKFREKHDLPVVTKRFEDVANLAIKDMQRQLDAGAGRKVYKDYIQAINAYFIPFFGKTYVTSIDTDMIREFNDWRAKKIGREPKASTLNTHNSAMNRVFAEAVSRGYLTSGKVPLLANNGSAGGRRPDFSVEDYRTMIRKFPSWIEAGKAGKSRDMRYLLRDYVLILANTGMRHGTEAQNLRWRHVHVFTEKGLQYVELHLHGKTVPHDAIGRAGTIKYLQRIHARTDAIKEIPFEQMLKRKLDLPVFCLPDGTVSLNLRQTFKAFLKDANLLKCPKSGQDRTLYSLRHTYATFALVKDGNGLFFAGDLGQRIFQQPFSWRALGLDVRGRSFTLRINYRTSHQIRAQADRLLPASVSDVDGNSESRRGTVSIFDGPPPSVFVCDTTEDEIAKVAAWIGDRIAQGTQPHEIGVFVRSENELKRARSAVKAASLSAVELSEKVEVVSGSVAVGTMHFAKGLEFKCAVVMACDDEIVPLQSRIETVTDEADLKEVYETERHLLYVACTRARDHLLVTAVDPASEFLEDLGL